MEVRLAAAADRAAIHALDTAAYGRADEAELAERLRDDGHVVVELVALEEGAIIGHALFARVAVEADPAPVRQVAALAVLAVAPEHRGKGAATGLIEVGLAACRAETVSGVVVVGSPALFPRFGFSAAAARPLAGPFTGRSFMAIETEPGALADPGRLRYPPAFGFA
jgi:putative acetyltransferase